MIAQAGYLQGWTPNKGNPGLLCCHSLSAGSLGPSVPAIYLSVQCPGWATGPCALYPKGWQFMAFFLGLPAPRAQSEAHSTSAHSDTLTEYIPQQFYIKLQRAVQEFWRKLRVYLLQKQKDYSCFSTALHLSRELVLEQRSRQMHWCRNHNSTLCTAAWTRKLLGLLAELFPRSHSLFWSKSRSENAPGEQQTGGAPRLFHQYEV